MLGRWSVRSYEEHGRRRGGRHTEATLVQFLKSDKGGEEKDQEGEEGTVKENRVERIANCFGLIWRGMRKE